MNLNVYLRCANNHPNEINIRDRDTAVGSACSTCGSPIQANPERERGPPRRRF